MSAHRPRLIALAIIRCGENILVSEGYDQVTEQRFYRPPGGAIEFGETGAQTAEREVLEELGIEIVVGRRLGTLENFYVYNGQPGHEVALVYEARLLDEALCEEPRLPRLDDPAGERGAVWKALDAFWRGEARLYPSELLDLIPPFF